MNSRIVLVCCTSIVLFVVVGCGNGTDVQNESGDWDRVNKKQMSREIRKRFRRAEKARKDLARTLFGRLSEELSAHGPARAIEVCNVEAQGMTRSIGEKHDVRIGRTSFRLRNPGNKPPKWARQFDLVKNRVEKQVVLKKKQNVAVLTPIHLAEKCTACHGPKEQMKQSVKEKLGEFYPKDEATGFKAGDLRGWFWVEVPREKS